MRLKAASTFGFVFLMAALSPAQVSRSNWLGAFRPTSSKVACVDYTIPKSQLLSPGSQCEAREFAKRGKPAMSPPRNGVAFGVSSPPNEPATVYVWVDNRSDQPRSFYVCCGLSFLDAVDVYDSTGRRLITGQERKEQETCAKGGAFTESCTCSLWISVPSHTMQIMFSGDIQKTYDLQPGRYFVSPARVKRGDCESLRRTLAETAGAEPSDAIMVTIPAK